MIRHIKLCLKHKSMVNGSKTKVFNPSLNVIIGPNGSGKSTILKAIYECKECEKEEDKDTKYHYFNSEIMNPHKYEDEFVGVTGSIIKIRAMFSSHGETMRDVLSSIAFDKNDCILLDEPETGHDLDWIFKIRKGIDKLSKKNCQFILASHHPVFWNNTNIIELKRNYKEISYKKLFKQIK